MSRFPTLAEFVFASFADAVDLRGQAGDLARGSFNQIPLGLRQYRPFKGVALQQGTGARRLYPVKDSYGGLDDVGGQEASGSLFSFIADSLLYVGFGQVSLSGASIAGAIASSQLRALLKWNNSYTAAESGPFVLGLPEPSSPEVGVLENAPGGTPTTSGTYTFKQARLRETLGGKSRASSEASQILTLNGKGAYLVVALPAPGQTHHPIFVTTRGLGGVGLHFRMPTANPFTNKEYTVDDVQRLVSTLTVSNNSPVVTSSFNSFTAQDAGKRFNPVSPGFAVPTGTTVLTVDSETQITLSNGVTVTAGANPRSAELIFYTNGIDRAVPLNWQESDLAGEAAEISWIYDFPPPASSHAFALSNRIAVATFADSKAQASAAQPGTALLFSLSNQFESFDVRFPLYLPEQLVDVIGRGIDAYSFLGTRNGIYAVQYINSETIPATVTVLLTGEGIKNPNNWTVTTRGLYACTGDGQLKKIGENGVADSLFFEPIRRYIRDWKQESTVLASNANNNGVLAANGNQAFFLDEQTGRWSAALLFRGGANQNLSIVAAQGAASKLFLTLAEASDSRSSYEFDSGTGIFCSSVSPYAATKKDSQSFVQQIRARFVADTLETAFLGVHGNNAPTFSIGASITSGSDVITFSDVVLTNDDTGCDCLIEGAGANGQWLHARIKEIVSASSARIVSPEDEDLSTAAPRQAATSVASNFALLARQIFPVAVERTGTIQIESPELFLNKFHSFAASIILSTSGRDALPLEIELAGESTLEAWNSSGAVWGNV